MTKLVLDSTNISQNPWVWDVLEAHRCANSGYMRKGVSFKYNNKVYEFGQDIFVRERKKGGYAYELVSTYVGRGAYGTVNKIACTISLGKNNSGFQVSDKKRVVKFLHPSAATREYAVGKYAPHLHMKKPIGDRLVMRNLGDMTLDSPTNRPFSRQERLALTKALLKAYKEQLLRPKLIHNDLHGGNILIKVHPEKAPNQYEVNIIDYGLGKHMVSLRSEETSDFWSIAQMIHRFWDISGAPKEVKALFSRYDSPLFKEYVEIFDKIILSPTAHTQKSLDELVSFFEALADKVLCNTLKGQILTALAQSTPQNMGPLKEAVIRCRTTLAEHNINKPSFPFVTFEKDKKRQQLFNQIEDYYQELEKKACYLCTTSQRKEGKQLYEVVNRLRKHTLDAVYQTDAKEREAQLLECRSFCKSFLDENQHLLNIRRNSNYVWGEIAVILASLIVLYPVALGINYLCTGRVGFFSETNSVKGAKKLDQDFAGLDKTTSLESRGY